MTFSGFAKRYRITSGPVDLGDFDPHDDGGIDDRDEARERHRENVEAMAALQFRLHAENQRRVLVVLQAMDAGGKDGTIRRVFSGINPQGCEVTSFKVPSAEEQDHGFLWRIHKAIPARGNIGVFNRSHYEDVLVTRVKGMIDGAECESRYEQINRFEEMLHANETTILKFFLYISQEEQTERLQERIDNPERQWKLSASDLKERHLWDDYMQAFTNAISACSTAHAPWFVIPANRKWFRNLVISDIVRETLEDMDPRFPEPTVDVRGLRL